MPPWNVSSRSCLHAVDCTNAISSTIVRTQATAKYHLPGKNINILLVFGGSNTGSCRGRLVLRNKGSAIPNWAVRLWSEV